MSNTTVAQVVRWVRSQVRGVPAHTLIWTLIACSATFCLLQGLRNKNKAAVRPSDAHKATATDHTEHLAEASSSDQHGKSDEQQADEEEEEDKEAESEDEAEEGEEEAHEDEEEEDRTEKR